MTQAKLAIFINAQDIIVTTNPSNHKVKITHLPTGIISECKDYKSHHKNRLEAMLILRNKLSINIASKWSQSIK